VAALDAADAEQVSIIAMFYGGHDYETLSPAFPDCEMVAGNPTARSTPTRTGLELG